jgi:hypothetical protein
LAKSGVAVEKLLPAKFAKIKLRQDALQTPFSVFLDIFYLPNFRCFEGNGVFQHPQAITLIDPGTGERMVNECNGDVTPVDAIGLCWEEQW